MTKAVAVILNRGWWEHLAPKPLVCRRREVERILSHFVASEYGRFWLHVVMQPNGVVRLNPGDVIPELRIAFLGDATGFILPMEKMRVSHRVVGTGSRFASGNDLSEGELVFEPKISVDVVTDPVLVNAARAGVTDIDPRAITTPSQVFSAPARLLISPHHFPKKAFVLYQHIFGTGHNYPNDGYFYVGVTTRSWQKRWTEHKHAIQTGSPLLFHRKYREEQTEGRISYVHHKVMGITDDLEALYATEEMLVEGHWDDTRRLNMIPGGKSGLKYLREHGLLANSYVPMPDDRDKIISSWLKDHPRKGLPAPWVSERWKDDNWAIAQICGRDGRLSISQVRAIRHLSQDHSEEEICARIGAKNVQQVKRVLDGKTYTRIT